MNHIITLFHIEENRGLSNMIIAVGVTAIGEFVSSNINNTIGSFLDIAAWIFIFRALKTIKFSRGNELGVIKPLVILLLMWNVFMIVYGLLRCPPTGASTYYIIRRVLTDTYLLLPMLFPLTLFFDNKNISLRFFLYWLAIFAILYIILSPWALWSMTHWSFSIEAEWSGEDGYGNFIKNSTRHITVFLPVVLGYYCKRYLAGKWWGIFVITALIGLFIQMYLARRGGTVMALCYFLAAYWIYFRKTSKAKNKLIRIFLLILAIGLGVALFTSLTDSVFSLLSARGTEDSRSGVEDNMVIDFDRAPIDWWIGRGLWGTYYDPSFDNPLINTTGYRWGVETGYLTMIIHGGYIYLGLYLSILVYAGFIGIFKGRNILVNSFGVIIIMTILALYPFGWQSFNFLYLTVWIGVFVCSQPRYINMTDEQIYKQFFAPMKGSLYNKILSKLCKLG